MYTEIKLAREFTVNSIYFVAIVSVSFNETVAIFTSGLIFVASNDISCDF